MLANISMYHLELVSPAPPYLIDFCHELVYSLEFYMNGIIKYAFFLVFHLFFDLASFT